MSKLETKQDPALRDHWYLQPWMTSFRPQGKSAESRSATPHPNPYKRPRLVGRSLNPEPFAQIRLRLVPRSPLEGGGLHLGLRPTRAALKTEQSLVVGLLVVAALLYLAVNAGFPERLLESLGANPGHPILWQISQAGYWSALSLAAIATWRCALVATPRPTTDLFAVAGIAALFQISLLALAGVLFGFGQSPYSSRPTVVVANLVYILAVLVAIELTRACTVVVIGRWNPTAAIAIGTVAFALIRFPIAKLASIEGVDRTFFFLGADVLPALATGLVASVLALAGGPLPAIVYGAVLQCSEWLSPILPDLEWATTAFVGTLGPVLVLAALQPAEAELAATMEPGSVRRRLSLVTGIAVVSSVWFAAGFFGVQPVAVSGPSMEPVFQVGDLVIVQDVDPEDVVVGDVIRFNQGPIEVLHRVIEIRDERGRLLFVTQGDANNAPDDPISGEAATGRVIQVIPKLGWPSIALRSALN